MTKKQWSDIWKALNADILDRRGLKGEWRQIDKDVLKEIELAWKKIIEEHLT